MLFRGSVVDVQFPQHLPKLYSQLRAGDDGAVAIEVVEQIDTKTVSGVALTPVSGLARGASVTSDDRPLEVPVGQRLLNRVASSQLSQTRLIH